MSTCLSVRPFVSWWRGQPELVRDNYQIPKVSEITIVFTVRRRGEGGTGRRAWDLLPDSPKETCRPDVGAPGPGLQFNRSYTSKGV